ncbi:MAG: methyltransferase domain-containing protein [archaeon]
MEFVYKLLKRLRWRAVRKVIGGNGKLLDIGAQDLYFYNQLKNRFDIVLSDFDPKLDIIKKEDVQNLSFEDNTFDVVLCQEVLEHVQDPVRAIKELKRVCRKRLIITVPNEPYFTLLRGFKWDREHLWALTPRLFKTYLGRPVYEKKIVCKRYYLGVWEFEK